MNTAEINAINNRLTMFARTVGDTPPETIIGSQGEPSIPLLDFCQRHSLTLDWAVLGEGKQFRRATPTATSVGDDATSLHGMLQGLDHLIGEYSGSCPASNAAVSLSQEVVAKCNQLIEDIWSLDNKGTAQ